ncbi:uncharacterized protein V6R79_011416 [Siganus canaliculatus]
MPFRLRSDSEPCYPKMCTVIWAAVFVSYGISKGRAMDRTDCAPHQFHQLDMAPNSVDDMYNGCKDKMKEQVQIYLENEKNANSEFKEAWELADIWYRNNWMNKRDKLDKEQTMAIYIYTLERPWVYCGFNAAVRTQRSEYNKTFTYHALHFFLTGALQTLNTDKRCVTVYRRVGAYFSQDVVNTLFRFGAFTSGSKEDYLDPIEFGDKSCFEIKTCFGADISSYSVYEIEKEVLIPPYEVFKVTDIKKRAEQNDLPCEVVYTVISTGKNMSNVNCALFPSNGSQQITSNESSEQYVTFMTVFAGVCFAFTSLLQ